MQTGTYTIHPEAYISYKKGRLRVAPRNEIFMAPGTEFEIELFNPTTSTVVAKISLNGKELSSGIVLRPGERTFLERFTDVDKKFKFETYNVNAKDSAAMAAIASNGLVSVSFHTEKAPYIPPQFTLNGNSGTAVYRNFGDSFTTNSVNCFYSSSEGLMNNNTFTSSNNGLNVKSLMDDYVKKETGRVEKGSKSKQKLQSVNMEFEYWPTNTVSYQILPISQENPVGVFCTECRKKRKNNWKFCPACGTSYEF